MSSLKVFCVVCLMLLCFGEFLEYRVERHLASHGISHARASHWLIDAAMAFEAVAAVSLVAAIVSRRAEFAGRALIVAGAGAVSSALVVSIAATYVAADLGGIGARSSGIEFGEAVASIGSALLGIIMLVIGGLSIGMQRDSLMSASASA